MASSFNVNQADLEYILKQIKIAEVHASGTPLVNAIMAAYGVTAANAAQLPAGLRTVDGTYNNLIVGNEEFGAADTLFPRLTDPVYSNELDGDSITFGPTTITNTNYNPASGFNSVADEDPRTITNLIVDMTAGNPAAVTAALTYHGITGAAATAARAAIAAANAAVTTSALAAYDADIAGGGTPASATAAATAAVGVATDALNAVLDGYGIEHDPLGSLVIPNLSPDIGLSPGFNSWMTFFGQFFDHGLDLVTKGGNGTIYVPLAADDPLIAGADHLFGTADDLAPELRFMALTRATRTIDANGVAQHENTTTSWIDQNQTYTSHSSHQVFLREYMEVDTNGALPGGRLTVSTGRLIDGTTAGGSVDGAIGNWGEVKAQALALLGINLSDFDVNNGPMLKTDQYGRFIPGANGYAQLVMQVVQPDGTFFKEGNPDGSVTTAGAVTTGHAFLNDIAHHAAPGRWDSNGDGRVTAADAFQTADLDPGTTDDGIASTYDDEMLELHFITGDGRGNENIALTSVHSVFHSEHNRLVEANKVTILESGNLAFINEWLRVDITSLAQIDEPAEVANLAWDGERLFQAARFATEMQYQHLVFEEFARRIQPNVDPFIFNSVPEINPSIVAEFAHTVYRFGHSMLTGTVDRVENDLTTVNGELDQHSLLSVFLNPQEYLAGGANLSEIQGNLIRGLTLDVGNEIDEFIVQDVRSNLLGLPLDLGALNIARGRETGIPSLNETRAQLYNDGAVDLKPYTGWADFAQSIKNPMSIINFIAAYGNHASLTSAADMAEMRDAATLLVFGDGSNADGVTIRGITYTNADRLDFLNGRGAYGAANDRGGLDNVDLWLGGLAEQKNEFGGMLGETFNFIFEYQMESLQFGDRLYYLTRTQGTNILNNLEPNSFTDLVMRNSNLGDIYSTHLNGALFVTPDHIIELDRGIAQADYDPLTAGIDPTWEDGDINAILLGDKVVRDYTGNGDVNANGHDEGGFLQVQGGEHYVLGGTEGDDTLLGDKGIDTLWGDGGDDYLNGGMESDDVFGGEGDDVIEDPFGDDVLRGNQGNDVISNARGVDLLFGDEGNDAVFGGQDATEVFAGEGDDFVLGSAGKDFLLGNEGSDWIEGGAGFDTIAGDNSELFFNSPIQGHDVLFNQGDEGDYDAESGDDIMGSGPSVFRYEGMFGFDWAIAKGDYRAGVYFDAAIPIFTTIPNDILKDRFDQVEAFSGNEFDDTLNGDDRGHKGGGSSAPELDPGRTVRRSPADPGRHRPDRRVPGMVRRLQRHYRPDRRTLHPVRRDHRCSRLNADLHLARWQHHHGRRRQRQHARSRRLRPDRWRCLPQRSHQDRGWWHHLFGGIAEYRPDCGRPACRPGVQHRCKWPSGLQLRGLRRAFAAIAAARPDHQPRPDEHRPRNPGRHGWSG